MAYRILASSGDLVVEAEAPEVGDAFVELARAVAAVLTDRSQVAPARTVDVQRTARDPEALLAGFANDLIYRFATEGFLAADGHLEFAEEAGTVRLNGWLRGEAFDPDRHGWGVEIKAATWHGLGFQRGAHGVRLRVLLDL